MLRELALELGPVHRLVRRRLAGSAAPRQPGPSPPEPGSSPSASSGRKMRRRISMTASCSANIAMRIATAVVSVEAWAVAVR
jgi:hypothetical protein